MFATTMSMHAQKFALVDMDYIFKNIPAYERANEQLNQVSKKWQAEVDAIQIEAQTLYKNYQNEVVFLSQEQKKARQDAIMEKEKEAADLKKKYFGPQGELFKKRTALMSLFRKRSTPLSRILPTFEAISSCLIVLPMPVLSLDPPRSTSPTRCSPS